MSSSPTRGNVINQDWRSDLIMSVNPLTQLLLDAQSSVQATRSSAESNLKQAEERDFGSYLRELSRELHSANSPEVSRQLAGLILKNSISGNDPKIDQANRAKWSSVTTEVAIEIKENAFETLSSNVDSARTAACQVISKVGRVEMLKKSWPELVPSLLKLVVGTDANARRGGLTAVGFLCEDLLQVADEVGPDQDILPAEDCNIILTGVVTGMKDANVQIKLAATKALGNVLVFAYRNVQNKEERTYLFTAIGENLRHVELSVREASWECALKFASEYYEFMEAFMSDLATFSLDTIKEGNESTSLHAIELWSLICEEELSIENSGRTDRVNMRFMAQAKNVLIPVLLEMMTKQESECGDTDEWTVAMAAGACICLCAEVLQDSLLDFTLPFISANFDNADWRRREAAVNAYGSIMEGPSSVKLAPLIEQSFEQLCLRLNDESVAVRDSTAWTVGRIAKFHFPCIAKHLGTPDSNSGLIPILISKLSDEPRVSMQICFALSEIADNCTTSSSRSGLPTPVLNAVTALEPKTPIDAWLRQVTEALYIVTLRTDSEENKLRTSAYTALGAFVGRLGGADKAECVNAIFLKVLQTLEQTVIQPYNDEVCQVQMELCACMEECLRATTSKFEESPALAEGVAERCVEVLTRVMHGNKIIEQQPDIDFSTAAEDALMAMDALAMTMGAKFKPFTPFFCRSLRQGLSSWDEEALCEKCIAIVGDLARLLQKDFASGPHFGIIMEGLYLILKDGSAKVEFKPKVMQTIGDVAFSVGNEFFPHLEWSLDLMKQATRTRIDQGPADNEEWLAFVEQLREGVLWAYQGIFLGLREDQKESHLLNHIPTILDFVDIICDDSVGSANQLKMIELLCDLVAAFPQVAPRMQQATGGFPKVLDMCSKSADPELKRAAQALKQLYGKIY